MLVKKMIKYSRLSKSEEIKTLTLLSFFLVLLIGAFTEKIGAQVHRQQVPNAGGTVNIYVANGNGLVAVTDSRLSYNKIPVGNGPKLFKVDDRTICSIAGLYSSTGQTMDGITYPAYTTIPDVIRTIISRRSTMSSLSLTSKINMISESVAFTLEVMVEMAKAGGDHSDAMPSEIMMATFDGNSIQIAKTIIIPTIESGKVKYRVLTFPVQNVKDVFVYSLAGMSDVGEHIFNDKTINPNDPILGYYYHEIEKDNGRSLSLADMQQIAKMVERLTANNSHGLVGGPIEMATIDHGEVKIVEMPEFPPNPSSISHGLFSYMGNISYNGSPTAESKLIGTNGTIRIFLVDSHFSYITQDLDGLFIYNTFFNHCRLKYNGSLNFMFSESNTVMNSTLELTGSANPDSATVRKIRKDFPQLEIIDHHVKVN